MSGAGKSFLSHMMFNNIVFSTTKTKQKSIDYERGFIMKTSKRFISALLAGIISASACFSFTSSAFADVPGQPLLEYEDERSTYRSGNNSFERAEYLPASMLVDGSTYPYVSGNFIGNEDFTDTVDYYSFSVTKRVGSHGSVSISLKNMPSGHNYDLYLYDRNYNLIASSRKLGNTSDVIKTPAIENNTTYYLKVEAVTVPSPSASSYRIYFSTP